MVMDGEVEAVKIGRFIVHNAGIDDSFVCVKLAGADIL